MAIAACTCHQWIASSSAFERFYEMNFRGFSNLWRTVRMKLDNHDKALPADHIESFFKSLDLAGECGLWSIAAILLYDSSVARNIEHFGSSAAIALLDQWREKLGKAQEYEATHGANSLYVKDHPFNKIVRAPCRERVCQYV